MLVPINSTVEANGWTRSYWSFAIPEGADGFGVMFKVGQEVDEKCWFDNIAVIKLPQAK